MTRMQKNKEVKNRRKRLIFPIITFAIATILLITVIDYRINNTLGTGGVRIVGAQLDNNRVTFDIFDEKTASLDFEFVKRDIVSLQEGVFVYVNRIEDAMKTVIKLD